MRILIAIVLLSLISSCSKNDEIAIRHQLNGMEDAWRSENKLGVAQFYADDGFLISSGEVRAHGRAEINSYWTDFNADPVDWILTDYITTLDLSDITSSTHWNNSNLDVPDWESLGIEIPRDAFYQLGKSELIWLREGVKDTGTVDFFLVWKKVDDAYLIYVDAYN